MGDEQLDVSAEGTMSRAETLVIGGVVGASGVFLLVLIFGAVWLSWNQTTTSVFAPSTTPALSGTNTPLPLSVALPDISGEYAVYGTNQDGSSYNGTATILMLGDNLFQVTWDIGGQTLHGTGTLGDGVFVVDDGTFVNTYTLLPDGTLDGTWIQDGVPGTGTEVLVFVSPIASTPTPATAATVVPLFETAPPVPTPTSQPDATAPPPEALTSSDALLQVVHHAMISDADLSPDGQMLAVASADGIWLYGVPALEQIGWLGSGAQDEILSVAWSPDGVMLAAGGADGRIYVWDVVASELFDVWEGHTDGVSTVDWYWDGSQLASGSWDNTVLIWDVEEGVIVQPEAREINYILDLAWAPYGYELAIGGQNGIEQTMPGSVFTGYQSWLYSLAWHPDGIRVLSGNKAGEIQVWYSGGGGGEVFANHPGGVSALSWSPDGDWLVSGGLAGDLRVWDGDSGMALYTSDRHDGQVSSVFWLTDDDLISTGHDGVIAIWEMP